jgi:hypothetical protein
MQWTSPLFPQALPGLTPSSSKAAGKIDRIVR